METLKEQIEYYRSRAGEYDEWFYRKGRYDQGEELNRRWFDEAAWCLDKLHSLGPVESALELAAGTGIWTRELSQMANHVTAIDASPEVLAINREKLGDPADVEYRQADLFEWEPTDYYDLVSFTFWLSHVPPSHVEDFLSRVYRATRPGGRVWMVDSRRASTSTATNQSVKDEGILQRRILNDGQTFEIVKVYYEPAQLVDLFTRAGFTVETGETPNYFIYALAHR